MEANENYMYFHCGMFIMLYKVLTSESVDETLMCDHSNERYFNLYIYLELFIMLYKGF